MASILSRASTPLVERSAPQSKKRTMKAPSSPESERMRSMSVRVASASSTGRVMRRSTSAGLELG